MNNNPRSMRPFAVSFGYILIALLFSMSIQDVVNAAPVASPKHIAVIDAGSSGTRLYFYKVLPDGVIETIVSNFEYKDEDGIDNFVCDPVIPQSDVMKVVITPLLTKLKTQAKVMVPPVATDSIEVNLLATAGMRSREKECESLYPGKGTAKVAALYKVIKRGISRQGFKRGEVRTSDGNREEGPWTWLNLNYVMGTLDTMPYGDLEVGGSSTQIVFPVDPATNPLNDAKNIFSLRYKGKNYSIFAKSYQGLGQDDARKWLRNSVTAPEKCWATGFDAAYDKGEKEITYNKLSSSGNFDYASCSGYYRQYIEAKMAEQGGSPQADRSLGDFVGLDGTWYAYEYFLTPPNDLPSQLTTAIPTLCASASSFESIATDKDVQFQCPNGAYVTTLMFDSAGLFTGSKRQVTLSRSNDRTVVVGGKNIEQREITWTRGYLLQRYFAD